MHHLELRKSGRSGGLAGRDLMWLACLILALGFGISPRLDPTAQSASGFVVGDGNSIRPSVIRNVHIEPSAGISWTKISKAGSNVNQFGSGTATNQWVPKADGSGNVVWGPAPAATETDNLQSVTDRSNFTSTSINADAFQSDDAGNSSTMDDSGLLTLNTPANSFVSVAPTSQVRIHSATGGAPEIRMEVEGGVTTTTITAGAGAPASTPSNGSIYLRTGGGAGTSFYVRESGAWVGK